MRRARDLRRLDQGGFGLHLVQHVLDLVLASAAIPFDPATGINLVRTPRAGADGRADPRFVQPIADADNHPRQARGLRRVYGLVANECQVRLGGWTGRGRGISGQTGRGYGLKKRHILLAVRVSIQWVTL